MKNSSPENNPTSQEEKEKNLNRVLEMIHLMGETEISELELDVPGLKVTLRKNEKPIPNSTSEFFSTPPGSKQLAKNSTKLSGKKLLRAEEKKAIEKLKSHKILSPMAGTFYYAPSPSSPPYVKEGDIVEPGQTVCIIEAMKLMNEIKAGKSGKIVKIMVEDRQSIEKDTELFDMELI